MKTYKPRTTEDDFLFDSYYKDKLNKSSDYQLGFDKAMNISLEELKSIFNIIKNCQNLDYELKKFFMNDIKESIKILKNEKAFKRTYRYEM